MLPVRFLRCRIPTSLRSVVGRICSTSVPSSSVEVIPTSLTAVQPSLCQIRRLSSTAEQTAEMDFHKRADETLHHLTDFFDGLPDRFPTHPDYDVTLAMGVLTVVVDPDSIYVINKQTPNRQLWLSSPISGPKRYDWSNGSWVYSHDGISLHSLLEVEFAGRFGVEKIGIDHLSCE